MWLYRLWRDGTPDDNIGMWIRKALLNTGLRLINRVFPDMELKRPQTRMLRNIEQRMTRIAEHERRLKPRDMNFLRFLRTVFKAAYYLGERDGYYALWIGYFMKHSHEQWVQGYGEHGDLIRKQLDAVGQEKLFTPELQERAWNLRLCGGLQLYDESLASEGRDGD